GHQPQRSLGRPGRACTHDQHLHPVSTALHGIAPRRVALRHACRHPPRCAMPLASSSPPLLLRLHCSSVCSFPFAPACRVRLPPHPPRCHTACPPVVTLILPCPALPCPALPTPQQHRVVQLVWRLPCSPRTPRPLRTV
ncbi:unnamed protein product, partial [Closterium sp. NIES-53]